MTYIAGSCSHFANAYKFRNVRNLRFGTDLRGSFPSGVGSGTWFCSFKKYGNYQSACWVETQGKCCR